MAPFDAYRSGKRVDDAEVAVTHGPEALGFPATSVAMVDIDATLDALHDDVPGDLLRRIRHAAGSLHFEVRTIEAIAARADWPDRDVGELLRARLVEQKRKDALALLDRLTSGQFAPPAQPPRPPLSREYMAIKTRALGPEAS